MHSFITCGIAKRISLEPKSITQISIKIHDRDKSYNSHILIEEIVTLRNWELAIDLIVIDMPNFNVKLNIDLLSKYGIEINWRKKKFLFNLDNENEFLFRKG